MSEKPIAENIVDVQSLWSLALQRGDEGSWVDYGAHNADPAPILRTYDFPAKGMEDVQLRVHRTIISVEVVSVEELREIVERETAAARDAAVQSE